MRRHVSTQSPAILIHRRIAATADKPIAALLKDLRSRGLLKDTIVLIGGEFGRTPAVETGGLVKVQNGRDHNSHGYSMLLAGGGVKGGIVWLLQAHPIPVCGKLLGILPGSLRGCRHPLDNRTESERALASLGTQVRHASSRDPL
jgi:hypothetical protein